MKDGKCLHGIKLRQAVIANDRIPLFFGKRLFHFASRLDLLKKDVISIPSNLADDQIGVVERIFHKEDANVHGNLPNHLGGASFKTSQYKPS